MEMSVFFTKIFCLWYIEIYKAWAKSKGLSFLVLRRYCLLGGFCGHPGEEQEERSLKSSIR